MKAPTIIDVARHAGVSIKTVSRVINHEPSVRDAMRLRVNKAIDELRYRPSLAARSLPSSRNFLIAVLLESEISAYQGKVLLGAIARCRLAGYRVIPEPVDVTSPNKDELLSQILRSIRVDGLILTPPLSDDAQILSIIDRTQIPYVRISPQTDEFRSAFARMEDEQAAYEMVMHLSGLGHSRIAFIGGDPAHADAHLRLAGYYRALKELGIVQDDAYTEEGMLTFQSGFEAADRLLGRSPRPTAIFAANDEMALGALAQAHRWGLRVPEDLSIAGFDDSIFSSVAWPQLTTIRQPIAEMASEAAEILINGHAHLTGEDGRAINRILPFELVVRASTAPPLDRPAEGD